MVIQNLRKKLMTLLKGNTLEEGKNVVEKREKQPSRVVEYQRLPPIHIPQHHQL